MSLTIDKGSLTHKDYLKIRAELIVAETESFTGDPKTYDLFNETEDSFTVPFCYGLRLFHYLQGAYKDSIGEVPDYDYKYKTFSFDYYQADFKKHINKHHKKREMSDFSGTLKDGQEDAIDNICDELKRRQCGILVSMTGSGKTAMGSYLTSVIKMRTLVIAPLSKLVPQWINTFERFIPDCVCVGYEVGMEIDDDVDIVVSYYGRVAKMDIPLKRTFGFVIIDEIHMCCNATFIKGALTGLKPRYMIGQTATFEKHNGLEKMSTYFCGEPVRTNFQKPWKLYIFNCPKIKVKMEMQRNRKVNYVATLSNLVTDEVYMKKCVQIVSYNHTKHKILILSTRVEPIQMLCEMLTEYGIENDCIIQKKQRYRDSQVVVASEKICGTGFDEASAADNFGGRAFNMVIRYGAGKDIPQFRQNLGRAFRSNDPIFILMDPDNVMIKKHNRLLAEWALTDPESGCVHHEVVHKCREL